MPLNWEDNIAYDNGTKPKICVSGTVVVEVHQGGAGGFGPLWYHAGHSLAPFGQVQWAADAVQYDNGLNPAVAVAPFGTMVVEVHQGRDGMGPLWYHVGHIQPNGSIQWDPDAVQYDNGVNPAIAIVDNTIVEVHQGRNGIGPLWYHVGHIQPNGSIKWDPDAVQYDNGVNPAIAIVFGTIVEVHQGTDGVGPLWYHVGQIQSNGAVQWAPDAVQYDNGINPAISWAGLEFVEVHQGTNGFGPLWYNTGGNIPVLLGDRIAWRNLGVYDNGLRPALAGKGDNELGVLIEVHQGTDAVGPLWNRWAEHEVPH